MANYTKLTAYDTKDSLTAGDPLKRVKGTELDDEFDAISTAIATKSNSASPEFTGTPTVPTASFGVNNTQAASTAFVQTALAALYPVGSIYTNATNATNPATLLGFGTWTAFAAGRVLVGFNASNPLFDAAEETGGSADATLPTHNHTATTTSTDAGHVHPSTTTNQQNLLQNGGLGFLANINIQPLGNSGTGFANITSTTSIANAGSSGTNGNYQPYITVYMWKRTS